MNLRWGRGISIGAISEGTAVILARLPLSWRGLGALVLGVLLAKWSWILFAPHATAIVVAPERAAAVETGRLFGVAVSGIFPAEGTALPNVRLVGVFATQLRNPLSAKADAELSAARTGQPGFAVLKLDDKHQVGVAVGESVITGTKLLEVHPDYVLLERAGVQQRVNLEGKR